MSEEIYHIPALLPQTIDGLDISSEGIYVDVTLGGGGHSRAIAERLTPPGHLYSLDRDSDAIARVEPTEVFTPIHGNFRYLDNYMRYYGVEGKVSGILGDLGVSFHHFDDASRGFSFRSDAPLDMRMNRDGGITAAELLASADAERLANIFYLYGELRQSRRLAEAIVARRRSGKPVTTTGQLVDVATPLLNPAAVKKEMAQLFQALRIVVNGEMEALEAFLESTLKVLAPGGRLAIITYHSLEDRLVKNFLKSGRTDGVIEKDIFGRADLPFKVLTNKPIVPDAEEVERNPRSRSAKLRIGRRL